MRARHTTALPLMEISFANGGGGAGWSFGRQRRRLGHPRRARHGRRSVGGGALTRSLAPPAQQADVPRAGLGVRGVARDGDERVFLLQEKAGQVLVLSADLAELLQSIRLRVRRDQPDVGAEWHSDRNSRGEALLLLNEGTC
jgi:hypothetical protein